MKVKDCMSKKVCFCTPATNIKDVAKLMCDNHVGCIPVCDNTNSVVGVVTDRDIILRTIACDKEACNTATSDVMTTKVCCCNPETSVEEATKLMSDLQIRRLPVCDENNHIVGIISLGDLAHNDKEIGVQEVCNTLENICQCTQNPKNAE